MNQSTIQTINLSFNQPINESINVQSSKQPTNRFMSLFQYMVAGGIGIASSRNKFKGYVSTASDSYNTAKSKGCLYVGLDEGSGLSVGVVHKHYHT